MIELNILLVAIILLQSYTAWRKRGRKYIYVANWINVKDRLPENELRCLGAGGDGIYSFGGFIMRRGTEWYWHSSGKKIKIVVTHWRPFPGVPKESRYYEEDLAAGHNLPE